MNKNIFSQNFNKLIKENNIKYVELSKETGIRAEKLSKFSNPKNNVLPSVNDLVALSHYFNISVDKLLGLSNNNSKGFGINKAFLTYDFLIKLFELNKLIPLEIEPYSESREILNRLPSDYEYESIDKATETYNADLALIKLSCVPCNEYFESKTHDEMISDFLLDWQKVKDAARSTGMPELEEIWIKQKLEELYSSCEIENMFYSID